MTIFVPVGFFDNVTVIFEGIGYVIALVNDVE